MTWIKKLHKRVRTEDTLSSARRKAAVILSVIITATALLFYIAHPYRDQNQLLNISYDAPRTYFQQMDIASGFDVKTSHAGSILQTESLAKGLIADVVCLSSAHEVEQLNSDKHIVAENWQKQFPYDSSPFLHNSSDAREKRARKTNKRLG